MNDQFDIQPTPKNKSKGCLIAALIFVGIILLLIAGLGFFGYKFVKNTKDKFTKKFQDKGYELVTTQTISINSVQTRDKLYIAQNYDQNAIHDGNLALLVQNATINDDVKGNLDCTGQVLTINENAYIDGDVSFIGQSMTVKGYVAGRIDASGQQISVRKDLIDKVNANAQSVNSIPIPANAKMKITLGTTIAEEETESVEQ